MTIHDQDQQDKPEKAINSNRRQYAEREVSLLEYWRILVNDKYIIFSFVTVFSAIGLLIGFLSTPVYRAEILLAPVANEGGGRLSAMAGQFGGLASLAGIDLGGNGAGINEALAVLNSREFTNKFILDENLMPILFNKAWDVSKKSWKKEIEPPTLWEAYTIFNKSVRSVSLDKKTKHVTLYIDWIDPVIAASWANKMISRLNARLRSDAIKESEENLRFLRKQISETSIVQIQKSIFGLVEVEMKKAMLANVSKEYAFKVIDPAVVPEQKIKPKRRSIAIMSFIIGGVFGVIVSLFRRYIRLNRS